MANRSSVSCLHEEALAAARAFDGVEAAASGLPLPAQQLPVAAGTADPRAAAAPATTAGPGASNGSTDTSSSREALGQGGFGPGRPYFARLLANERVTAEGHFQDVRHLELEVPSLEEGGPGYRAGDVLAIVPRQPDAAVEAFLLVGAAVSCL